MFISPRFQILKLHFLSFSFIKVNQSPFLDQLIPTTYPLSKSSKEVFQIAS